MTKDLENIQLISRLLDIYGSLLSNTSFERIDEYVNSDYSLSEIAENSNTSRSATCQSINLGINKLFDLESKLHLYNKFEKIIKIVDNTEFKDQIIKILEE